jgi:hypothetical protein
MTAEQEERTDRPSEPSINCPPLLSCMAARAGARPAPTSIRRPINAVHADADSVEATDWLQIVALDNRLLVGAPTPVVALNRAIAVGEVDRVALERAPRSPRSPPGRTSSPAEPDDCQPGGRAGCYRLARWGSCYRPLGDLPLRSAVGDTIANLSDLSARFINTTLTPDRRA